MSAHEATAADLRAAERLREVNGELELTLTGNHLSQAGTAAFVLRPTSHGDPARLAVAEALARARRLIAKLYAEEAVPDKRA